MKEKNLGIEIIRIVSMLMVMILHILDRGGLFRGTELFSIKGQILVYMEYLSIIAVNLFALITGYLSFKSNFNLKRIISLWLQVLFFSWIMLIGIMPFYHIGTSEIAKSIFPTVFGRYWYFNSYLVLYLLLPFVNLGIQNISQKMMKRMLVIMFLILSVVSSISTAEVFYVNAGYSPIWLLFMYLIGSYISKFGIPSFFQSKAKNIWMYLSLAAITLLLHDGLNFVLMHVLHHENQNWLLRRYSFPLVLIMSICVFCYLLKIKVDRKYEKKILFFSTSAFGAYLFQTNPLFFHFVLENSFIHIASFNIIFIILIVLLCSFAFFIIGILIDKIRITLIKSISLEEKVALLIEKLIYF